MEITRYNIAIKNFIRLTYEDISELSCLSGFGYVFDWTARSSSLSQTVAYIANGDVAGLVEYERQEENKFNYSTEQSLLAAEGYILIQKQPFGLSKNIWRTKNEKHRCEKPFVSFAD